MYIPKHFRETDQAHIIALANEYAFASLVTVEAGLPFVSHLPVLIEDDGNLSIVGHMARANEQWRHFERNNEVLVMFQGPHSYISPSLYETAGVPTWNYASVHMYGVPSVVDDGIRLKQIVEALTCKYEKLQSTPWIPDYPETMLAGIIGFSVEVNRIEAKYKLSQNKSAADRKNIIACLSESGDTHAREMARLMRE